jgi:hypothetical protein
MRDSKMGRLYDGCHYPALTATYHQLYKSTS